MQGLFSRTREWDIGSVPWEQDQEGAGFEGGSSYGLGNPSGFVEGQRAKRVHRELGSPASMRKYIFLKQSLLNLSPTYLGD